MRDEDQEVLDPQAANQIMILLVKEVKRRLKDDAGELKAADFEFIRKLMADNGITISSCQRGDFGNFAQKCAENLPFDDEGLQVLQ